MTLAIGLSACKKPDAVHAEHVVSSFADEPIATKESRASMLVEAPRPVVVAARGECEIGTRISCMPRMRLFEGDNEWRDSGGPYRYSERELFAGFGALAALDANVDGVLDARDPAFGALVLWSHEDQDKTCTPDELRPLGVTRIPLAATPAEARLGSYEGEMVPVTGGRIVDVYLADTTFR